MKLISLPRGVYDAIREHTREEGKPPEFTRKCLLYLNAVSNDLRVVDHLDYYERNGWNAVSSSALQNHVGKEYTSVRYWLEENLYLEVDRNHNGNLSYDIGEANAQRIAAWSTTGREYRFIDHKERTRTIRRSDLLGRGYRMAISDFKHVRIDYASLFECYGRLDRDNRYISVNWGLLEWLVENLPQSDVNSWLKKLERVVDISDEAETLNRKLVALNADQTKERYFTIERFHSALNSILSILFGRVTVTNYKQKGDRLGTSVANVAKWLRPYIHFNDGNAVYEIDIKNSQVLFFACFLQDNMSDCTEKYEFINDASAGIFYERLMRLTGLTRNAQKVEFFRYFFGGTSPRTLGTPTAKAFSSLYPKVARYVKDFKRRNGYAELAVQCQRQEAHFFFLDLVPLLRKQHRRAKFYTVHDSIVLSVETSKEAEEIQKKVTALFRDKKGLEVETRLEHISRQAGQEPTHPTTIS